MYETSYTFKIYPESFTDLVMEAIKEYTDIRYFQEECRWENSEGDMQVVSSRFPKLLMSVFGDGEDSDDLWRRDYLNGVEIGQWQLEIPEASEDLIRYVHYLLEQ